MLVFPLIRAVAEQATYNGYSLPRLEVLREARLYRELASLPFSISQAFLYLRLRRIMPLATAHWLMDGGDAFYRMLWPLM